MKFLTLFYYGLRSVVLRGPLKSLRIYWQEKRGDAFYGISTRNFVLQSKDGAHHYQGASYYVLNKLFKALNLERLPHQFFDIGCGLGRVLFVASANGFKQCRGIDINDALINAASKNILSAGRNSAQIEIQQANATEFNYPKEAQLYFLFNPFDDKVLKACLNRIIESGSERSFYLYMNPVHKEVFEELGFISLQKIKTNFYTEAILFVGP